MQKVAAYLLERRDELEWPEARVAESDRLRTEVLTWLKSKGASGEEPAGSFVPEDGSAGTYSISQAADGDRAWWMLVLNEDTAEGRRFTTAISITSISDRVSVYITLEVGSTTTHVVPISVDPRCPRIVRQLLRLSGRWYHGRSELGTLQVVSGFQAGEAVAYDILNPRRTVPVVVVSQLDGEVALPHLDNRLSDDLAGLANVFLLDEDATWALTDTLGNDWSCYWGAVRLFWPQFARTQDRFSHPLWTCTRLRSQGQNARDTLDRFRRQMRGMLF